jgi:hypothetical protein
MPQSFEIKLERQSGGWVWAAFRLKAEDGTTIMVAQSSEAFATEELARLAQSARCTTSTTGL